MIDVASFQAHRSHLFGIAYRMLGSASEAEDVLQDAWLRASAAPRTDIQSPRAWLGTIVTRLCLDRLKTARAQRETYVGPWLPEPILTAEPDAERAVEQDEWVTLAFLTVLDSLAPQERAVFLLREVFDYDYAEIAGMLELTPANCRQLVHRAKGRIAGARPRRDRPRREELAVAERFMSALASGDADAAAALLTDEVTWRADGGGKVPAAKVTLTGRAHVGKLLHGLVRAGARLAATPGFRLHTAVVNAEPAVLVWVGERLDTVFVCSCEGERIAQVYAHRNPDKLRHLETALRASRG
jgi:RNA polymerase sigma-70 factor (ECF subfamily)